MPLQATPDAPPDSRRLYGFTTRGGIVWRDLSNPTRAPWTERTAQRLAELEQIAARFSLDRGQPRLPQPWVAPVLIADDLPTAKLPWTHPDSTPFADIEEALAARGLSIEER